MKNKWLFAGLSVIAVLLVTFLVLQANSMTIALSSKGLKTDDICYIAEPYTDDTETYAVVQTYTKDGTLSLVQLKKNVLGFWSVATVKTDKQFVQLAWLDVADPSQRTDYKMQTDGRYEWHYVCCGSDALGNIELSDELLPDNTTVSIRQTGQNYTVYLISFHEAGFGDFSLRQMLLDNGFVSG